MNTVDERNQEILEAVAAMIRAVIGEEWLQETPITMESSFSQDLEVESIEFVALAEKLQERYGMAVDFAGWLAGMELDEIINLKVGQLVEFIASCQS